jgi:2'-5' RNA ligase
MDDIRESVIVVPVPAAESLVQKWRKKYDQVSLHGIPSHITILFPFKNPEIIDERIINSIRNLFSNIKRFEFSLIRINTFPDVVYLEPEPKEKFIELTKGIVNIFPENPWFERKFKEIKPHLTIGNKLHDLESTRTEISQDIISKLPIKTLAIEAWLMESKDGEWSIKEKFPFAL